MHRFLPIHPDIHELLQDADLWILNESFKWWAHIASQLPGRTDSEIKKNFWNSHLKKRLTSIGPKLQINHSSSPDPINIMCESPSSCHMVQWESASVEAEARLSMQSLLLKHTSTVKGHPDIFIQLWNSEVGEAFRNINGKDVQTSESPVSDTRPCVKNTAPAMPNKTSTSIDTTQEQEDTCKPSADVMSVSDSIGSNELEILQIQH